MRLGSCSLDDREPLIDKIELCAEIVMSSFENPGMSASTMYAFEVSEMSNGTVGRSNSESKNGSRRPQFSGSCSDDAMAGDDLLVR